ncbi:unnamed protein product, partial [Ectocarpus fasciculatus]
MSTTELSPPTKLPIWQTVKAGYSTVFDNPGALARAAALPVIISILLEGLIPEESGSALGMLRIVLTFVVFALFQIVWLRFLLLRSTDVRPGFLNLPGRRFLPFLGYSLLLLIPYLPALLFQYSAANHDGPVPVFTIVLIVAFYAFALYLGIRFGFTFLWIAIDAPQRLGTSWRATRKNGLRIAIAFGAVAAPLFALFFVGGALTSIMSTDIASQLETGVYETWLFWILLILGNATFYLYYALACTVMARAFSALTGW